MKKNYIIILLLLFLSFGYAYLSTNLTITGLGGFGKNTWKIYFDNIRLLEGEDNATILPVTVDDTTKDLSFEVNLLKPGDKFKFLVDVVNGGSIDSMVNIISKTNIDSSYANFKISYADNVEVNGYDLLKENSHDTLVVVLEYKLDVDETVIGLVKDPIDVTVSLDYIQADEDAKERQRGNTTLLDGEYLSAKLKQIAGAPIVNSISEINDIYLYTWIDDENIMTYLNGVCYRANYYNDEELTTIDINECLSYENDLIISYYDKYENINVKRVVRASYIDDSYKTEDNIISVEESNIPAYAWLDDGILNYYSDSDVIYFNEYAGSIFYNFVSLEDVVLDTILLDYSTNISYTFSNCSQLKSIRFINYDTSNVTNFALYFAKCESLGDTYINELNFDSATNLNSMYWETAIESVDLSNANMSNVTDMAWMFRGCDDLKSINLSGLDLNSLTDMECFVYDCVTLESFNMHGVVAPNLEYLDYAFRCCTVLTDLDISSLCSSKLIDTKYAFCLCEKLVNIDLSNFDTSNVNCMQGMFYGCYKVVTLDLSNFDTSKVIDMSYLFYDCKKLKNLNMSSFDTSKVTDMSFMFCSCKVITNLDFSNFNTVNVTTMQSMLRELDNIVTLDLSSFNTSKVTNMQRMIYGNEKLANLDVSSFNTSNVTRMDGMFAYSHALISLDLNHFDTRKVEYMGQMFYTCKNLTTLHIENFKFDNVSNVGEMFSFCYKLQTTINLGTNKITSYQRMFQSAANSGNPLVTINYASEYSDLVDKMIATNTDNNDFNCVVKGSVITA